MGLHARCKASEHTPEEPAWSVAVTRSANVLAVKIVTGSTTPLMRSYLMCQPLGTNTLTRCCERLMRRPSPEPIAVAINATAHTSTTNRLT
jgi:hypothetical protein